MTPNKTQLHQIIPKPFAAASAVAAGIILLALWVFGSRAGIFFLALAALMISGSVFMRELRIHRKLPRVIEEYRAIFEVNTHPMWILDVETLRFLEVNEAAIRQYGYSREEFLSIKASDLHLPENIPAFLAKVSRPHILDNDANLWWHRKKDGSTCFVQVTSFCIVVGGKPAKLVFIDDLTHREMEREHLARAKAQMHAIVSSAMDGIVTVDSNSRIVIFNSAAERMFGHSSAEMIGSTINNLVPEQLRARHIAGFDEFVSSGVPTRLATFSALRADGQTFPVEASITRVEVSGQTLCTIILRDITERHLAEAQRQTFQSALEKAAREWKVMFDAFPSAFILIDGKRAIERLNFAAKKMFGDVHYRDVIGHPISDYASVEPWREVYRLLTQVSETGKPVSSRKRDTGGSTWDIAVTKADKTETAQGPEDKLIVVLRDVTRTIALQDSLRRSEAMASIGALVGGIAHEVRNPLFGISSTIDTFEVCFGERSEFQEYISILRGEVERLRRLMQELLEYGKPPTNELTLGSVRDAIEKAVQICQLSAKQAGVSIRIIQKGVLPHVLMKPARLTIMFRNLIENAIQQSPRGSEVVVESVMSNIDKPIIVCNVADSGPGFRDQDLSRVFTPFFSRRQGGTGLGLSIVQRVAEEHSGTVRASNRPGRGAVVEVRLPLTEASGRDDAKSQSSGS